MSKTFPCPNCTTPMVVDDPAATDTLQCPNCLNSYLLEYDDFEEEYHLVPEEPPQFPFSEDTDRI